MPTPIIYITRGQMPDDFELEQRDWYRRRHSTDLLGVGFWSARGYRCPTTPQNCNVYELPNVEILSSDDYMNMRKNDPYSPTVMKAYTYLSASVYAQAIVKDPNGETVARIPTMRGPVLEMVSFDHADGGTAVSDWFERSIVDRHRGKEAVRTVRLWEQCAAHPLFPPKEPRWCVAVEWTTDPGTAAARLLRAAEEAPIKLDNIRANIATKWYGLVREDIFES
jgi:hypothetical protein